MGEKRHQPCQLSFHKFLRVEFQGLRVISNGGLVLIRDLDERLGLAGLIQKHLMDSRTGRNTQFPLADLSWQSVYS
jgi:Transposase DDE domain group 1